MKSRLFVSTTAMLVTAATAAAQSIYIAADPDGSAICTEPPTSFPASFSLYVIADPNYLQPASMGIVGAEFAIHGFEGLIGTPPSGPYMVTAVPNAAHTVAIGDPLAAGVNIAFPNCQTAHAVLLYTLQVVNFGDTQMRQISIVPRAGESCPRVAFCDANYTTLCANAFAATLNVHRLAPPATDPFPVDAAQEVPTQVTLRWHIPPIQAETCEVGTIWQNIYFGTSPNPPYADYSDGQRAYTPPPLAPDTTYYWRIEVSGNTSPVWSFTTGDQVAAYPVTWTAVRGLYR